MKFNFTLVLLFSSFLLLQGCLNSEETPLSTTTKDLPAVFERFTDNVNVYVDGIYIVIETDDIPNHGSPYFNQSDSRYEAYNGSNANFNLNPNRIATQSLTFRIPYEPVASVNNPATPLGAIGVALNGVVFYNQYAGPNNQPLTSEIDSFDQYLGHPQQVGQYHYHQEPTFLTSTLGNNVLLGWLLDGFPVYGPYENGVPVTASFLDDFHGHNHATADYPLGSYHYHITAEDPYINGSGFYGVPGTVSQ
jgi:hypothetical protein